jgi:CheY-like chemotaxis protein
MVLAAVDDLLFSSKIRATAKAAGVDVTFARSRSDVLEQARLLQPALIVFDLNSAKIEPIDTIAALKSDPALAGLRALGFVSHVDTSVIHAARAAGADEVLARSAFAGQLADILTSAGKQ